VVDNGRVWFAAKRNVDGLLSVEDAPGGVELLVLLGEERDERLAVGLAIGMEKALLK
jgi:hypothetical protein